MYAKPRPVGNELLRRDRRVVQREFYPLPAILQYGFAGGDYRVGIHNFSEKGLCFRSDVRFPVGATVEITAELPRKLALGGRKVRYFAKVVRVTLDRGSFTVAATIHRCDTLSVHDRVLPADCGEMQQVNSTGPSSDATNEPQLQQATDKTSVAGVSLLQHKGNGRQFSRYQCASEAQFRSAASDQVMWGQVVNLSLAGCYLHTPDVLPVGTSVEVVIQKGKARIHSYGRVKVVDENKGMGLEFEGSLPTRLQRLPRLLNVVSASRKQPNCLNN